MFKFRNKRIYVKDIKSEDLQKVSVYDFMQFYRVKRPLLAMYSPVVE